MTQAQLPTRPPSVSRAYYRQHPALIHGRASAGPNGHPAHGGHPMAMGNPRVMNPTQSITQQVARNAKSSQPRVASVPTGQQSVSPLSAARSQRNPTPSRPMEMNVPAQAQALS